MSNLLVTDALTEIRAYLGDDHPSDRGASPKQSLILFLQREYDAEWGKLARKGVVPPLDAAASTTQLTWVDDVPGPIDLPTNVLAVIDVFQFTGSMPGSFRYLEPVQQNEGHLPFDIQRGVATKYAVYGMGEDAAIQLWPWPGLPDDSAAYYVRYVPTSKKLVESAPAAGETMYIEGLPSVATERVVLGATRRALQARREASPQLNDLIRNADDQVGMFCAGRMQQGAPKARNVDYRTRGWAKRGQDTGNGLLRNPELWIWIA